MNTVKTSKSTKIVHKVEMEGITERGAVTRRDIGDFIMQADRHYEATMGHKVRSDDAYYVFGDEDGLTAYWEADE